MSKTTRTVQETVIAIMEDLMAKINGTVLPTDNLIQDLNMDSLDIVEFWLELEEEFSLEIPEEDIEQWKTVADVITYLEKRVK